MAALPPYDWVDAMVHISRAKPPLVEGVRSRKVLPGPRAQVDSLVPPEGLMSRTVPVTSTALRYPVKVPQTNVLPSPRAQVDSPGLLVQVSSKIPPHSPISIHSIPIGYPMSVPYLKDDFESVWGSASPARVVHYGNLVDVRTPNNPTGYTPFPLSLFKTGQGRGRPRTSVPTKAQNLNELSPKEPQISKAVAASVATFPKSSFDDQSSYDFQGSLEWQARERPPLSNGARWRPRWVTKPVMYLKDIPHVYLERFPGLLRLTEPQFHQLRAQIPRWGMERGKTDYKRHKRACRAFLHSIPSDVKRTPTFTWGPISSAYGLGRGITLDPLPPLQPVKNSAPSSSSEDESVFEDAQETLQ